MDGFAIGIILGAILLGVGAFVMRSKAGGGASAPVRRELDEDERRQVANLVEQKRLIEAIKFVRTRSGMGLTEAKDYVDGMK